MHPLHAMMGSCEVIRLNSLRNTNAPLTQRKVLHVPNLRSH